MSRSWEKVERVVRLASSSTVLSRFKFPDACYVGQRIAKTLFGESEAFAGADRRLFAKDVEETCCAYLLDAEKTHLAAEVDDERDFSCLAVIDISLRSPLHATRIAELCHRAMPYPLLIVLHDPEGRVLFAMSEKRQSRDGRGTTVLEKSVATDWLNDVELDHFFAAADFAAFAGGSFADLHAWYFERMEALNVAQVTGVFSVGSGDPEKRRAVLAEIHRIDGDIADLRRQVKSSLPVAELVELNVKLKALERCRESKIKELN